MVADSHHFDEEQDPDHHLSEKLDPDPYESDPDPQPWVKYRIQKNQINSCQRGSEPQK